MNSNKARVPPFLTPTIRVHFWFVQLEKHLYKPIINALGSCCSGCKPCSFNSRYLGDMSDSFPSKSDTTRTEVEYCTKGISLGTIGLWFHYNNMY